MILRSKKSRYIIMMLFCIQVYMQSRAEDTVVHVNLKQAIDIALSESPTVIIAGQEIEKKKYAKKEITSQLWPQLAATAGYTRTVKKQIMYMGGDGSSFTSMLMDPVVALTKPLYDKLGVEMPDITAGNETESSGDGGMEVGLDNNWSGGFGLSLPVFAPTLYKSIQLSAIDIDLAAELSRSSKQDLVNQVSKAYFQFLLAQDSYEVIQQSYKQAEDNADIVRSKFEQGLVSEYDKIRAEVQVRNLSPNLIQSKNAISLTRLQLKVLIGLAPEKDIVVSGKLSDYEKDLYYDYMKVDTALLANNSTLKQMDLQSEMLKTTYEMSKAAFLPNISFDAVYQWTAMNNDFKFSDYVWNPYGTIGLSVSFPIFTGGSRIHKMKQTKVEMNQLYWNRTNLRRNLSMQVENCLNNMQQSIEQLASNKENVNQAIKGRNIAQKRYEVGQGTILELNDSELALTQSKLTYTQAIYDFLVAKADLDLVLGKEPVSE